MRRIRILIGLVVTVIGVVWLVARLGGVAEAVPVLVRWSPAIVTALGILNLLALVRRPAWLLAPLLLIVGGAAGLFVTLDRGLPDEIDPYVWPVVVTVIGATIALWERERVVGDDQFVRQTAVLRSRRFHGTTTRFRHGIARAFLGNLELDLRRCVLKQNAELSVTVAFGHVDLLPPRECQVQLVPPLGLGVAVPTLPPAEPAADPDTAPRALKVSVIGFVGGFDVRAAWDSDAVALDDEEHEDAAAIPPSPPAPPPKFTVPAEPRS
jgi:hypothetical protein